MSGRWLAWLEMRPRIMSGLWWGGLVGVAGREGGEVVRMDVGEVGVGVRGAV